MRRALAVPAAVLGLALLSACGSGGVTAPRLEASLSGSFSNLYRLQQQEQGDPVPAPGELATRASCQRGTQADRQQGAGNDWLCQVTFLVAGPATPVNATYSVDVKTDGCYAAEGDGPTSLNGNRTIQSATGSRVNPLRLVQGCFDVG